MSDTHTATATLRPGDPPPFWEGMWHPEGKADGAVMVRPGQAGAGRDAAMTVPVASAPPVVEAPPIVLAAPPVMEAAPIVLAAPPVMEAAPIVLAAPPAAEAAPIILAAPAVPAAPVVPEVTATVPQATPMAAAAPVAPPATTINLGPPPEPVPAPAPVAATPPPQAPPAAPPPARSFVLTLAAQGPLSPAPGLPTQIDAPASEALRAKAKELQGANQLGPALQALSEALRRSPGEAATYAQMGQALLAGRAWEDAAHHFLVAYMLAPREPVYGRMTLHAAFVLGYVGWAFQLAQTLYKVQPTPDLIEMGRQSQGWLQSRTNAVTALCSACRTTVILGAPGPCPKCGATPLGAPCNASGFAGLKLLQQAPPTGRLFAGASCISCKQDTLLVVTKGGPRCQACQGPAVAPLG